MPPKRSSSSSSSMGRESAKSGVTRVPDLQETESSSSSGASIESSSSSSNGEDVVHEVIDVDAASGNAPSNKDGKREWVVPRTLSWTSGKVVQPVTKLQRRTMGRSRRHKTKKCVGTPLLVSTHRLTAIPESYSTASTILQDQEQQQRNEPYEDLVRRVEALELGAAYKATKEEVEKVEVEFLMKLRAIREALAAGSSSGSVAVDSTSASNKELEALKAENEALKRRNAKLEYRVQHVVGEMGRLYDQVVELKMSVEDTSMAEF